MTDLPKPIGWVGIMPTVLGGIKVFAGSEDMLDRMGEAKKFKAVFTAEDVAELIDSAWHQGWKYPSTERLQDIFRAAYCKAKDG